MSTTPDLVTTREAATLLGCDPSTVNRLVKAGHLTPARTVDGQVRVAMYLFKRADVRKLGIKRGAA